MSGSEQDGQQSVPLAEAAARLGLSRDALRMRIRRGKAKGFKRGRQIYVWLQDGPSSVSPVPATGAAKTTAQKEPWSDLLELQKQEIARLIQETDRLNARLDLHLNEVREMRQMLQREQVLRQQEQNLRRDIQRLLDRLTAHPALIAASVVPVKPNSDHAMVPRTEPGQASPLTSSQPPPSEDEQPGEGVSNLAEMLKDIGQSLRAMEASDPSGFSVPETKPGKRRDET